MDWDAVFLKPPPTRQRGFHHSTFTLINQDKNVLQLLNCVTLYSRLAQEYPWLT